MKTILLITAITLSTSLFSQEIKSKISLAGYELQIYQKKKVISSALIIGGAGLATWGSLDEENRVMLYLGGLMTVVGVSINIEALTNLGKASKHLIEYK